MNEADAKLLAKIFDGEAWHSGGQIWLVRLTNSDGRLVVFSDELVSDYASESDFENGKPIQTITLL